MNLLPLFLNSLLILFYLYKNKRHAILNGGLLFFYFISIVFYALKDKILVVDKNNTNFIIKKLLVSCAKYTINNILPRSLKDETHHHISIIT